MNLTRIIELANCPLGNVFDVRTKDWSIEKTHFAGWTDAFANPIWPRANSLWRVVDEDDQQHVSSTVQRRGGADDGGRDWRDYTVTACVRQMHSASGNTPDDEHQSVARSGLLFRYGMQAWGGSCVADCNHDGLDEVVTAASAARARCSPASSLTTKMKAVPR